MEVRVHPHAIGNCLERVMDVDEDEASTAQEREAASRILLAVAEPDWIYHGKKEMPPIHVKDGIAIPVGVEMEDSDNLRPYSSYMEDLVVMTTYKAEVFERKRDEGRNKARA